MIITASLALGAVATAANALPSGAQRTADSVLNTVTPFHFPLPHRGQPARTPNPAPSPGPTTSLRPVPVDDDASTTKQNKPAAGPNSDGEHTNSQAPQQAPTGVGTHSTGNTDQTAPGGASDSDKATAKGDQATPGGASSTQGDPGPAGPTTGNRRAPSSTTGVAGDQRAWSVQLDGSQGPSTNG